MQFNRTLHRKYDLLTDLLESDGDTGVVVPATDCFKVNSTVR